MNTTGKRTTKRPWVGMRAVDLSSPCDTLEVIGIDGDDVIIRWNNINQPTLEKMSYILMWLDDPITGIRVINGFEQYIKTIYEAR